MRRTRESPLAVDEIALLCAPVNIRTRKLVGAIALIIFIVGYSLIAMEIGAAHFSGGSPIAQAVYFLIAGLVWVLPAGLLVRWMQRPDQPQ